MSDWWSKHNFPVIPEKILPINGYICYLDNKPICGVYIYLPLAQDGGCLALCEYWTANPEATKEEKDAAFPRLLKFINEFCKENEILVLYTGISNPSLIKRLEKEGWQTKDHVSQMMMDLTKE